MRRAKDLFDLLPRLWQRVLREAWLPAVLGTCWFIFARFQGKNFYDSSAAAAWLFFFAFFLQGQFLRIRKNVNDEDNNAEQRTSLREIRDLVRQLGPVQPTEAAPFDGPPPQEALPANQEQLHRQENDFFGSDRYFAEANEALEHGLHNSAALTAAVAFDHVLRDGAREYNIDDKTARGIVRRLALRTESNKIEKRLNLLLSLRNKLVHPKSFEGPLSEQEARELVRMFEEGVELAEFALTGKKSKP